MKALYSLIIVAAIVGCQRSEHAHHDDATTEPDSTNTILYNQVMDIHDEVMPKMEELYNLKKDLQAKLAASPTEDVKKTLLLRLGEIDSASTMMEDWMHEFNPPADTTDQEQIRAYLEGEMEKVKRVREAMINALGTEEKN